jgi:transcriptional regulator with XRE-family HTH domain
MKTNFDRYLAEQMNDASFAKRFEKAGQAWDVALQIVALREAAGWSQKDLARKLKTSQQQVSRLESPAYEGHSLRMLRRVAEAMGATVHIVFESSAKTSSRLLTQSAVSGRVGKKCRV